VVRSYVVVTACEVRGFSGIYSDSGYGSGGEFTASLKPGDRFSVRDAPPDKDGLVEFSPGIPCSVQEHQDHYDGGGSVTGSFRISERDLQLHCEVIADGASSVSK
jgi:hypothetical protein